MEFRFLHADHLRLASSVRGIADGPGWLKSLATGAFRQATRNVIEQAIVTKSGFVVIAGTVTDSDADLDPVVRWLDDEFEPLRQAGIPVIAWARDSRHRAALTRICRVVLTEDQRLDVLPGFPSVAGELRFEPRSVDAESGSAALSISVGRSSPPQRTNGTLHYHIQPSQQHLHANRLTAGNGLLTTSAGATQAAGPEEQHACGCLLVQADVPTCSLSAEFVATDVLRFRQQNLSLAPQSTSEHLRDCIANGLQELEIDNGRTLLVDWIVTDTGRFSNFSARELCEADLLKVMRDELQSGHRGIWPRTVRYADSTMAVEPQSLTPAMREFLSVMQADGLVRSRSAGSISGFAQVGSEALTGLKFLARAA